MPGGRMAHSRFKIPLNLDASSTCCISKQSNLAELIRRSSAIICEEAPMMHRFAFEALDRTFEDIIGGDLLFGGKVIIFGGDFRQVLPVVHKGTRSQMVQASLVNSSFWKDVRILRLQQNMRSINDPEFSKFLLNVGNGGQPSVVEAYMVEWAIITPKNDDVDVLNEMIIKQFPGPERILYSFDSVEDDTRNMYQQEFLNSISPSAEMVTGDVLFVGSTKILPGRALGI
ncbi:uncharacterized protein LOC112164346 [Rosa chinensis]|uniref:uncharacterized protein LOC112164346 n=1 Tax=Rosa chinensis TaxID=74649 RepID=UPI000D08A884|nr:uncharacterized protein LOC112164346 [Rosa chinensis]